MVAAAVLEVILSSVRRGHLTPMDTVFRPALYAVLPPQASIRVHRHTPIAVHQRLKIPRDCASRQGTSAAVLHREGALAYMGQPVARPSPAIQTDIVHHPATPASDLLKSTSNASTTAPTTSVSLQQVDAG